MSDFLNYPEDSSIVVTGAGSGIGRAIALTAARQGLAVSAWDLSEEAARACAQDIEKGGGKGHAVGVDVSDPEAVSIAFDIAIDRVGEPLYLAAVAGPPSFGDREFTEGLNLAIDCMRVPTEVWIEKVEADLRSAVYASSVVGPRYGAGVPWYAVAKAAIDGYVRSLAAMRPGGIRANAVLPDWTLTPRTQAYVDSIGGPKWDANPMGRIGSAQDIANGAVFLLSPSAEYINGISLEIEGGARLRSLGWLRMHEFSEKTAAEGDS